MSEFWKGVIVGWAACAPVSLFVLALLGAGRRHTSAPVKDHNGNIVGTVTEVRFTVPTDVLAADLDGYTLTDEEIAEFISKQNGDGK